MMNFPIKLYREYLSHRQEKIDENNRKRLTNTDFTLICSNCAGGFLYHWLGLQFRSPFINLFMSNEDFLFALGHFDEFISTEITEDTESDKSYPVGIGFGGVRLHFMHYPSFADALEKWNTRKARIDMSNAAIMLTNFEGDYSILERFERLPFKNKKVFTEKEYPEFSSVVCLKGYKKHTNRSNVRGGVRNVWFTQNYLSGRRYIDRFDYVSFFNGLK